ncbi:alpha-galactosidase [Pontibacillus halophilus JSM 076056 = DSM 19796]|uniref:Alpha-galactosidase n=1 Tax=Pontibacillus halophilus JSM 076056 = DSM 19796 TaxID=1385510 RepID=A0A0A5GEL3_9BACI|nr:alpha-galactosidase [Pontibacillus halophilus]KGX91656.1 alpha-galactosidase [Pontibacillus halophilus JSM 076056 = DSM 19796]
MPITIAEQNKQFHLQGKDVSYIFHVMKNGHLGHLYYGKKIRDRDSFSHLAKEEHRVTSSYVYEDDPTFSLDLLKQEYPSYGTSDYREPAYQIEQQDGSRITDFTYHSHVVTKGKPPLEGLPAVYTEGDDEAETLTIKLVDTHLSIDLYLSYTVFHDRNVIIRSARFVNSGEGIQTLTRALSTSVEFPDANFEMAQLSGSWSRERHFEERPLVHGLHRIQSTRGTSSSQQNPFLMLKRPETTESLGEVYGFSLVYSGNFLGQVEVDQYDVTRVTMGINPFDFSWELHPGEAFQTPEVVMAYSDKGMTGLSHQYQNLYQKRLARGNWRDEERPILINNWEATYFDFDEEKLLGLARTAKAAGVELFVLDDGWFGKRNDDTTSLGDWFIDQEKLPKGLQSLSDQIHDLDMMFGLWFEPEMVSRESELFKEHPEWIIHVPERRSSTGRHQLVLDFSNQEVVDLLFERMSAIIREAHVDYVKWDMNRYMTEIGSCTLPASRQKEVAHRYILGVYDLYERLTHEFPDVLFESCASGGARFDPGMLYYAPQAWTSDNTDAIERLKIQYGTSFVYPISSMGAHVSAVPNHQVRRITSLKTRADVAYFGTFGYELDLTAMGEQELHQVANQISWYKDHRRVFQYGTFYRLKSPFAADGAATSWMSVSDDQSIAVVGHYQVLAKPNPGYDRLFVKGLDPDGEYEIEGREGTYYGDELMNAGIQLDSGYNGSQTGGIEETGDFVSTLFTLKRL